MPARSRRQKTTQLEHAFVLVNRLAKRLTSPQHQHRMQTTNQLIPLGSLKRRCVREIFQGWVHKAFRGTGRVLTKKLVALVVRRLRLKLELPDCYDISSEVSRLQYLLKVARKRLKPKPKTKHMSNVDNMDTLLQVFDDEHPTPAEMGVVNPEDCTLPNVGEGIWRVIVSKNHICWFKFCPLQDEEEWEPNIRIKEDIENPTWWMDDAKEVPILRIELYTKSQIVS